jgi:hypothetical protein
VEKIEPFLMYSGQAAILASSVWVMVRGRTMAGVFLLLGFLLIFQFGHVAPSLPEGTGSCWATEKSYYECLPIWYRTSAHLGQLGLFVVAFGVFQFGRSSAHNK